MSLEGLRVVITDTDLGDVEVERKIIEGAGARLTVAECRTPADVISVAHDADALLVQSAAITSAVFDALPNLRVVVRYGSGLDNVDLDAAMRAGVTVQGVVGYCTDEVADHAMALLLAITRGLTAISDGLWKSPPEFGRLKALRGTELGIVGFGRIGRAVAARAAGFGMHVGAFDPHVSVAEITAAGVEPLGLEQAFRRDVVSLHLPLVAETRRLIGGRLFGLMPDESILLNLSRGGVVDEEALLEGLAVGRPAFAALDVLDEEPPHANHPLVVHPRTLVTPHIAFYSTTSVSNLRRQTAEQIVALLGRT